MRDLGFAIRTAAHYPWLTVSSILLIGAALAANTALFSAVHVLVLRDLPVQDLKTLRIIELQPGRPISQATLDELQRHPAFAAVGAVMPGSESEADPGVFMTQATANLCDVLGVTPSRGAWLNDAESEGVVIAWSLWQARFAGQTDMLGRTVEIAGRRRLLLGVMPQGFDFPLGTNVWELAPRRSGPSYSRFASFTAIGRLRSATGVRVLPGSQMPILVPLPERYTPAGRPALFLLLTGAALVLVLTVLHLIALGLGQIVRQRSDAAIRLALGAERRHLCRQALAEAAIPALGGLLVALAFTLPIQSAAGRWLPPEVLRGSVLTLDWHVLAFGSGLSVLVLVVISGIRYLVVPWHDPRGALSAAGASRRGSRSTGRVVLGLQTACAAALLYLCSLAVTSLVSLQHVNLGFTPSNLFCVSLPWGDMSLTGMMSRTTLVQESVAALRTTPGVQLAIPTVTYPLASFRTATAVNLPDGTSTRVELVQIDSGYFDVLRTRIYSGRDFDARDTPAPPLRTVVNESLARTLSRDGVLPRTVQIGGISHEIIGVVANVRSSKPELDPGPQAYVSIEQRRTPALSVLVRTDRQDVSPSVLGAAIQSIWDGKPIRVEKIDDIRERLLAPQRTRSVLMSGLALAGFALTLVALAGGLTEGVRSRTMEIAVRIALGADVWRLARSVVGEGLVIVLCGGLVGLGVGAAAGRAVRAVLYGISALDARIAVLVIAAFALVGVAASGRAAVIACRVDPARTLKSE